MAKRRVVPAVIPIDPVTIYCPFCGAKKGKNCLTSKGGFGVVHVLRIQAAALLDAKALLKKTRDFGE